MFYAAPMMAGGRAAITGAAVAAGVATAAISTESHFRLAASQPQLRGAIEMAASLLAVLVAVLAAMRLQRRRTWADLALASALAVIALANVLFAMVPDLAGLSASNAATWSAIIGRLLGGLLFGVAAFVPERPLRRPARAQAVAGALIAGSLAALFFCVWAMAARWPNAVALVPAAPQLQPALHAAPVLPWLESLTAVVNVLAAVGYLNRSRRSGDEYLGWLAVAAVFATAANVNYALYPSLYVPVVSAGDAFRLGFFLLLFIGSAREVRSYWGKLSEARVTSERRRIARDLHDGLAQELAYLTRHLKSLEGDIDAEELNQLRRATERARLESRLAINGLAIGANTTASEALADAVGQLAKRLGLDLELDLLPGLRLPVERTDALARIACEAITNAARHSGVNLVVVSLHREGARVRMLVRDMGSGFDPSAPATGFGLTSMRERAQLVGAVLTVSSEPGRGSQVEVLL
jgi:signal transduction histidine kinase